VVVFPPKERFVADDVGGPPLRPVWTTVLCDDKTPVAAYALLSQRFGAGSGARVLLESVVGGERWGRYSVVAVGHRALVSAHVLPEAMRVRVTPGPGFSAASEEGTGLDALRSLLARYRADPQPDLPPVWGGLVGVWGHDVVRCFERLPIPATRGPVPLPAIEALVTDTVVVFDNLSQRVHVIAGACPAEDGGAAAAWDRASARVTEVARALAEPASVPELQLHDDAPFSADPAPPFSRAAHLAAVETAKRHIRAGDIFQVVLAQAFEVPREGLPMLDVYRTLRVTNPAPYMYLMELPSAALAGASPEVLVRVDRATGEVTVRPIAGTRPRGRTPAEDLRLEEELLADPKERAEHLMLLDLGRNDVGRVCEGGSVRVVERFAIERYSRVMHIVSEVRGALRAGLDAFDALGAAFPAGTLSGAPKVRALQIIDELEPDHRGWYGGAVGWVGFDGGADFAICIRSVVARGDTLRVQAGGGIVVDSTPEGEDAECRNKASAVLRAIAMAKLGRVRA
jgi:anthranilate synthase component 1